MTSHEKRRIRIPSLVCMKHVNFMKIYTGTHKSCLQPDLWLWEGTFVCRQKKDPHFRLGSVSYQRCNFGSAV